MSKRAKIQSCIAVSVLMAGLLTFSGAVWAQDNVPQIYRGADLKLGQELILQHKCTACHVRKVGGDGSAIYRPAGRISTAGYLRGMVEQCNTELGLGMLPEETTAVAAVLNRDYYRHTK